MQTNSKCFIYYLIKCNQHCFLYVVHQNEHEIVTIHHPFTSMGLHNITTVKTITVIQMTGRTSKEFNFKSHVGYTPGNAITLWVCFSDLLADSNLT